MLPTVTSLDHYRQRMTDADWAELRRLCNDIAPVLYRVMRHCERGPLTPVIADTVRRMHADAVLLGSWERPE